MDARLHAVIHRYKNSRGRLATNKSLANFFVSTASDIIERTLLKLSGVATVPQRCVIDFTETDEVFINFIGLPENDMQKVISYLTEQEVEINHQNFEFIFIKYQVFERTLFPLILDGIKKLDREELQFFQNQTNEAGGFPEVLDTIVKTLLLQSAYINEGEIHQNIQRFLAEIGSSLIALNKEMKTSLVCKVPLQRSKDSLHNLGMFRESLRTLERNTHNLIEQLDHYERFINRKSP